MLRSEALAEGVPQRAWGAEASALGGSQLSGGGHWSLKLGEAWSHLLPLPGLPESRTGAKLMALSLIMVRGRCKQTWQGAEGEPVENAVASRLLPNVTDA